MEKIYFKLTFLDEIVLSKSSNTEGNIYPLDFISGSCFLGIVAREYDSFNDPFLIFHSGKVRFGEATLLHKEQRTYKIPFCFFAPKIDYSFSEVYNHHFVDYSNYDYEILTKQLKQIRNGFITKELEYIQPNYNYTQKTAYDTQERKSKDSAMFGYTAFTAGSSWVFSICFDEINKDEQNKVIDAICGEKFIGKSKSAQYGKVLIQPLEFKEESVENFTLKDITYVYVDSTLALFDEGMPTWIPTKENLGLKQGEINWEKSQIRIRKFSPFNSKRQCKESTRMIIEKGSVIAISNASNEDIATLKQGIGAYLSEGYGEVLINPSFICQEKSFALKQAEIVQEEIPNFNNTDERLVQFLQNRQQEAENTLSLWEKIDKFIKQYKNKFQYVSTAQWGEIRMHLQFNPSNYRERIKEYITRYNKDNDGQDLKQQWKDGGQAFLDVLEKESIEFLKLLTITMQKESKGEDNA